MVPIASQVCRDPRWGRCYESYSEVPEIVRSLTTIVTGLQGQPPADHPHGYPTHSLLRPGTPVSSPLVMLRAHVYHMPEIYLFVKLHCQRSSAQLVGAPERQLEVPGSGSRVFSTGTNWFCDFLAISELCVP
jgi:hypothetical protein